MKNSNIKERIVSTYSNATPEILDKIKASCEVTKQEEVDEKEILEMPQLSKPVWPKRIAMVASFVLVFGMGLWMGNLLSFRHGNNWDENQAKWMTSNTKEIATIRMFDSPQVELKVDETNRVLDASTAGLEEAEILQSLHLKGIDMETAIDAIVGAWYLRGNKEAFAEIPYEISADTEEQKRQIQNLLQSILKESLRKAEKERMEKGVESMDSESEESREQVEPSREPSNESNDTTNFTNEVVNHTTDAVNEVVNNTTNAAEEVITDTTNSVNNVVDHTTNATNQLLDSVFQFTNDLTNTILGK